MSEPQVETGPELPEGAPADPVPRQVGRYRVERILGQGSFARVYLAHDGQLQRLVAIKVPHHRLVSRPEDLVELLDGTTPDSAETAGSDLAVAAVQVHLVLEGAAGAVEDMPTHPLLDVVHAPADGDSAIVDLVEGLVGGPGRVLVVTADRALRARVHAAGAEVTGPGTFRAALPEVGPR